MSAKQTRQPPMTQREMNDRAAVTKALRDHKIVVPMAKRRSFKPENAFAAIARKYGVSIPTVKAIFPPLESKGGNEKSK